MDKVDYIQVVKLAEELVDNGITDEESAIRYFMIGSYGDHSYGSKHVEGNRCANCKTKNVALTIEHILALSLCGGTDFNTCILCFVCNKEKGNKFNLGVFNINKLHPRFVTQFKNLGIDFSKLSDENLMFTLCKLASSYRNLCIAVFRKELEKRGTISSIKAT
jgi:hypothetical protein